MDDRVNVGEEKFQSQRSLGPSIRRIQTSGPFRSRLFFGGGPLGDGISLLQYCRKMPTPFSICMLWWNRECLPLFIDPTK
jgi:hypothetical protein